VSNAALEHWDIQALFRGFGVVWPWAYYSHCALTDDAAQNRRFVRELARAFDAEGPTSVATLDANKDNPEFSFAYNIAFSHPGLKKLAVNAEYLFSFPQPYIEGMRDRSSIIGDKHLSTPEYWEEQWRDRGVHVIIAIYARSESAREEACKLLQSHLDAFGVMEKGNDHAHRFVSDEQEVWIDDPTSQPTPGKVLEHFGFQDGISNPPIRGLHANQEKFRGSGKLLANGTWEPLAAGEFLYGYTDEIGEIPVGPKQIDFTRNGSYLVYRKLSQDVDGFRNYIGETAESHGMSADFLASKFVGRDRDGKTLATDSRHGADINDFLYEEDIRGTGCPLGSHARRANPRDTLGFDSMLVDRHRILRRAITYGKLVPRGKKQASVNDEQEFAAAKGGDAVSFPEQGLIFLALNVDLDRQFEFVQSEWINYGNDFNQGECRDPLIGCQDDGRMLIPGDGDSETIICSKLPRFIETRGGDYFFLPGLKALSKLSADPG